MHTPEGFVPGHVLPALLPAGSMVFAWQAGKLLVQGRDTEGSASPRLPSWGELEQWGVRSVPHYLGTLADVPCVAVTLDEAIALAPDWGFVGLRTLFHAVPEALLAVASRAFQIVEWNRTHRFCGHCATPLVDKLDERARECPACGLVAYPRVTPAMMVLVVRDRALLLARSHRFGSGIYSALAGFVEAGETVEDCIHREVAEEVGITVRDPVYFGSQSWPFPHSLMLAYTAEYAGGELRIDDVEIADARWFAVHDLPPLPVSVSIARRLIEHTVARLKSQTRGRDPSPPVKIAASADPPHRANRRP